MRSRCALVWQAGLLCAWCATFLPDEGTSIYGAHPRRVRIQVIANDGAITAGYPLGANGPPSDFIQIID